MAQPDTGRDGHHHHLGGAQRARNVPAANAPIGSVEQVAAKVVPSVVKLETKMGRASEEGSGIILSADGLILTNSHVVSARQGAPSPPPRQAGAPGLPGGPVPPARPDRAAPGAGSRIAGRMTTTVTFADGRTAPFTVVGTDPGQRYRGRPRRRASPA